jgi:peptidase E
VVDILMGSWTSSLPSTLSKKTIYVGTANFVFKWWFYRKKFRRIFQTIGKSEFLPLEENLSNSK